MATQVHTPVRQCRICRTRKPKAELTRWVKGESGWVQDEAMRLPGRGVYTCSPECAAKLLSGKRK